MMLEAFSTESDSPRTRWGQQSLDGVAQKIKKNIISRDVLRSWIEQIGSKIICDVDVPARDRTIERDLDKAND